MGDKTEASFFSGVVQVPRALLDGGGLLREWSCRTLRLRHGHALL